MGVAWRSLALEESGANGRARDEEVRRRFCTEEITGTIASTGVHRLLHHEASEAEQKNGNGGGNGKTT